MIRRHCGIDLNGWRDTATRSWTVEADGDVLDRPCAIDGGIFGSLAKVGDGNATTWVGGYQASLAPHGRGPGWGDIGDPSRRVALRDLIHGPDSDADLASAALAALSGGATHAALAIDDTPLSDEDRQERLLAAMHRAGLRRRLLVWRPVLTVLAFLQEHDLTDGTRVGVINHAGEGFAVQTLRIRREAGRSRDILAPERKEAGLITAAGAGYKGLERAASDAVSHAAAGLARCETPRAVGRLTLGLPAPSEILLSDMRRWVKIEPPATIPVPEIVFSEEAKSRLTDCDVILFETLAEGDLRHGLIGSVRDAIAHELVDMPASAVADGGVEAARRLATDEPIYFDFLPQISTIVTDVRTGEPASFDLIEKGATLPAGRIYRSARPARLGLDPGQQHLSLYLNKENADWPRKAKVDLGTRVNRQSAVELLVEQAPLAGSARIMLRSPALARQHVVDWSASDELRKDWQSLIKDMETPKPTVPKRLVLPCGTDPWEDGNAEGLLSLLDRFDGASWVDWQTLAQRMSSRPFGKFCISSDGEIPAGIPQEARDKLNRLSHRATEEELERLNNRMSQNNERLRFLLWQFRRCPPEIIDHLISAIENRTAWSAIFSHWAHWKMVLQGVGRCAYTSETEGRILRAAFSRPASKWTWWGENACLSFILSRSDTGPQHLSREMVETAADSVIRNFRANLQNRSTDYTTFFYAPFLLAGLLRWRLVSPRALVEGQDPVADRFASVVRETLSDIQTRAIVRPALSRYVPILKQLLDELRGEGTNPELLLDIFGRNEDVGNDG